MCDFVVQLVEHLTGIAEVTGSNPVEALIFSGFFFPIAKVTVDLQSAFRKMLCVRAVLKKTMVNYISLES